MSIRTDRVASVIKEELGGYIEREFSDPSYGMITVTEVVVSGDLRHAKVYVSLYGNDEARKTAFAALDEEKKHIRSFIASRLRTRYAPEIDFQVDDTLDRVDAINTILRKIHDAGQGHE